MGRVALMFMVGLITILLAMSARAENRPVPNLGNLIEPPSIIKYQGTAHAIFNLGDVYFLYKVTKPVTSYPQCNALELIGKEIRVVGHNPGGYLYFVEGKPVAFKTDHNPQWTDLIKRTFENGR